MSSLSSEQQRRIQLELARLLVGVYSRTTDSRRRRTRTPEEHSTMQDCPEINDAVRAASGRGLAWTDAHTWALLREQWTAEGERRPEVLAARELLYLVAESATTTKHEMRRRAIERLELPGEYKPSSIRLVEREGRDGYSSEVLNKIIPVLLADVVGCFDDRRLDEWFLSRRPLRNDVSDPLDAEMDRIRTLTIDRLDRPSNPLYPERLTTRILAMELEVRFHSSARGGSHSVEEVGYDTTVVTRHERVTPMLSLEDRIVLRGGPGSGKSTIAAALTIWHLDAEQPALYVRASDFARCLAGGKISARHALVDAFASWLGGDISDGARAVLEATVDDPAGLVVIDGADEVADGVRIAVLRDAIDELSRHAAGVIVTARPGGVALVGNAWHHWTTDDLTRPRARSILDLWFETSPHSEAHARARRYVDAGAGVTSIPLLLGFVAILAANRVPPADETELFDACVDLFLVRVWKPLAQQRRDDFTIESVRHVVLAIAWNLIGDPDAAGHAGGAWSWEQMPSARAIIAASPDAAVAREIVRVDGLLVARGFLSIDESPSAQRYEWLHRAIYEHLVATELAARYERDPEATYPLLRQVVLSPAGWNEVLRRFVIRLSGSRQRALVERFVSEFGRAAELRSAWLMITGLMDAEGVEERSRVEIASALCSDADWSLALDVDARTAIIQLTGGAVSLDTAVTVFRTYEEATGKHLSLPVPWLRQVLAAHPSNAQWVLERIARQVPDFAIQLAVPLVERGEVDLPSIPFDGDVDDGTYRHLVERVRDAPFPASYRLGRLLTSTVHGCVLAAEEVMRGDTMLLLDAFGWNREAASRLKHVVTREFADFAASPEASPSMNGAIGSIAWAQVSRRESWSAGALASADIAAIQGHLAHGRTLPSWLEADPSIDLVDAAARLRLDDPVTIVALTRAIAAVERGLQLPHLRFAAYLDALEQVSTLADELDWRTVLPRASVVDTLSALAISAGAETDWPDLLEDLAPRVQRSRAALTVLQRIIENAPTNRWPRTLHSLHPIEVDEEGFLAVLETMHPHVGVLLFAWRRQPNVPLQTLRQLARVRPAALWNDPRALAVVSGWFSSAGVLRYLAPGSTHAGVPGR